jgi:hypothetical protein
MNRKVSSLPGNRWSIIPNGEIDRSDHRFAVKRKHILAGVILLAMTAAVVLLVALPQRDVMPVDGASARLALQQALKRQHFALQQNQIELLSTTNTFLSDVWLFGVVNPNYQHLGGPRYQQIYLVGPLVAPSREVGFGSFNVTTQFTLALENLLWRRAPKSESEALEIARGAASLLACTRPDRLNVLGASEVPPAILSYLTNAKPEEARRLAEQLSDPKVEIHPGIWLSPLVYTVEFYTYLPESWGDIVFWHMEIGERLFSASRRPIYLGSRGLQ